MAIISKVFTLGCVVTSAGQINEISESSLDPGLQTLLLNSDGQVDPTFAAVLSQAPMMSFSTMAIARALGYAGISGLAVAGTAVDLWFQKYQTGGTRLTGSNSTKLSITYGLLCPRTLTVSHNQPAVLTYQVLGRTNDGTTAPVSITLASAMPSIIAADQLFTAGPVKINGTAMEGIQQTTIDFGLRLLSQSGGGIPFNEFIAIEQRQPKITVRSTHLDFAGESGMGFYIPQSSTDSLVYLRKIAQNGNSTIRVPDATAEHISASIDDGVVTLRNLAASQGSPAMLEALIEPAYDGTNNVIAMNLATAIA